VCSSSRRNDRYSSASCSAKAACAVGELSHARLGMMASASTWYCWGYGHASLVMFVAAWRHVVRVLRAAGAANVTWLWTVNTIQGASS